MFGIIAAGGGSRLSAEGIKCPKPLVKIGGEPLIDRLIRVFMTLGATDIVIVCNDLTPYVARHLQQLYNEGVNGCKIPLQIIVKTTISSMHSFFEISRYLNADRFVVTTVDTVFREEEFVQYVKAFQQCNADGLFGVTDYIDDEKPLYVDVDDEQNIQGFYDTRPINCRFISGGIYGLTDSCLDTLHRCVESGESRMRNFQRALLTDGFHLKAFPFTKVIDVDHVSDIKKAEVFLHSN